MAEGGIIELVFRAKLDSLDKDMGEGRKKAVKAAEEMGTEMEAKLGAKLSGVGKTMTKTLTPAAGTIGVGMGLAFKEFDAGADAITARAGLVGAEMDAALASMKTIGGQVNVPLSQIGETLADVASAAQLTGQPLEDVAGRLVRLKELGQTVDAKAVGQFLNNWGIGADQAGPSMDRLFAISQKTGVGIDKIIGSITTSGGIIREFGLSWDQAAGFVAKMESQGIDADATFKAMSKSIVAQNKDLQAMSEGVGKLDEKRTAAIAKFGPQSAEAVKATKDMEVAQTQLTAAFKNADVGTFFADAVNGIKSAGTEASANAIAIDVFGAKAGPQLAAQIREGKLGVEDFTTALPPAMDNITKTYKATLDWGDKLEILKNKVIGVVGPVGEYGMAIAGIAAGIGPVLQGIGGLVTRFGGQAAAAGAATTATTASAAATGAAGASAAASSGGFFAMAAGVWAALAPFLLIALAIAAVVAVGILLWKNWDSVLAAGKVVFGWIKDGAGAALGFLKDNFLYLLGPIGMVIKHWDTLKEAGGKALDWVKNKLQGFLDFVTGIPEKIGGALRGAFDGLIGAFKSAWNWVAGKVNGISFSIPGWVPVVGGKTFSMPNLPVLDEGGIVSRPTLALLAANSRPEAVVPLDRMGSGGDLGGGGGQVVNQYIAGSVVTERQLAGMARGSIATVSRHNNGPGF